MSDETSLQTKSKLNKKLLIGVGVVVVLVLVVVLPMLLPKPAEAKKQSESLDLGDKYISELNYEQVVISYLTDISIDPKNVDAYLGLAEAYVALGEYDEAIRVLEDALDELWGEAADAVNKKLEEVWEEKKAAEATPTPSPTVAPTTTSTPTPEPTVTSTPTPVPTATSTPVPTATSAPTPTPTAALTADTVTDMPETSVDSFSWQEYNGTITIIRFNDKEATVVSIPNEIEGKPVTGISNNLFYDCGKLEILYLPANLKKIGNVDGTQNSNVILGDCMSLKKIVVSDENENFCSIDGCLLSKDQTRLIRVPWKYTGTYRIPDTVMNVCPKVMENCSGITEIVVANNKLRLYGFNQYFDGCISLERFVVENGDSSYSWSRDGLLYYGEELRLVPPKAIQTVYSIPNDIVRIHNEAFALCENLEKVFMPAGIQAPTSSGKHNGYSYACAERNYFKNCYALTEIEVDTSSAAYTTMDGVLYTKDKAAVVSMPCSYASNSYIIPEGVTAVACYAFYKCSNLIGISLPSSLEIICPDGFYGCSGLIEVTIPVGVKVIGVNAFANCTGLTEIVLPEGLEEIHDYAFSGCKNLKSITIPASVTKIGNSVISQGSIKIITPSGSAAEQYAIKNNIPYENY